VSGGDWKDMFGAACAGDLDTLRHHLAAGVDPDHVHPEYQSTALVACLLERQAAAADVLLDHGASPLLVSPLEAQTPVQAARQVRLAAVEQRLRAMGAPDPSPPAPARGGWFGRLSRS
jgi:ankyrin repeat protein